MNTNTLFIPHLGKVAMKETCDEGLMKHKRYIQDKAEEVWAASHPAGNCYWKVKIERKTPMRLH